jgi:Ca2+-binding EF-hand superfamily protein
MSIREERQGWVCWKDIEASLHAEFTGLALKKSKKLVRQLRRYLDTHTMTVGEFWTMMDVNEDNSLTYSEFEEAVLRVSTFKPRPSRQDLRHLYAYFDQDGNGEITFHDVKRRLGRDSFRISQRSVQIGEKMYSESSISLADEKRLRTMGASEGQIRAFFKAHGSNKAEESTEAHSEKQVLAHLMSRLVRRLHVENLSDNGLWTLMGGQSSHDLVEWPGFKTAMLKLFGRPIPNDAKLNMIFDHFKSKKSQRDVLSWAEIRRCVAAHEKMMIQVGKKDVLESQRKAKEKLRRIEADKQRIRAKTQKTAFLFHGRAKKAKERHGLKTWSNAFRKDHLIDREKKQNDNIVLAMEIDVSAGLIGHTSSELKKILHNDGEEIESSKNQEVKQ